jgi:hypothetical protein
MAEDEWGMRAELAARQEEIAMLRGVVAALRGTLAGREASVVTPKKTPRYAGILVALFVGILCGASLALLAAR